MKWHKLDLSGPSVMIPEPIEDNRGSFSRIYCSQAFKEIGVTEAISQINHSFTRTKGSVRGLHYQFGSSAEIKIIKCIKGAVFDVIVDIRKGSPTFLQWQGINLSYANMKILVVPKGFAHGFQSLEPDTELIYLHTAPYTPSKEGGVHFADPTLRIDWPLPVQCLSERDLSHGFIDSKFTGVDI